ncbi:transketolase [Micromonospora halophytica]|uniref:Transketolase subunit A n=1 Tax=Micromonospora halophytica TaxID=47864 RepID=A0A1C5JGL1_9ACTN|nr:transketolase [Micromonospora halophytica]SCG69369.1 transketolase subunit A [Micromonospora halophytica]
MTSTRARRQSTLELVAARIRAHVVDMCAGPEGGHLGGALSSADILAALYFSVLNVDPQRTDDPDRDRFVLSKGHAAVGLYAALAERGYFPVEELTTYGRPGSRLMGHPVRAVPGVELPTGSLGHGLALGCGFALAHRYAGRDARTFVLLGDGELQEGSVWEAAIAAASLRLERLTVIVDRNGLQLTGATDGIAPLEPLADRWRSFGWAVRDVAGHDPDELARHLDAGPWEPGRPSVLIARTVKGRGLPFLEGRSSSHYVTLSPRNHARAVRALRTTEDAG